MNLPLCACLDMVWKLGTLVAKVNLGRCRRIMVAPKTRCRAIVHVGLTGLRERAYSGLNEYFIGIF